MDGSNIAAFLNFCYWVWTRPENLHRGINAAERYQHVIIKQCLFFLSLLTMINSQTGHFLKCGKHVNVAPLSPLISAQRKNYGLSRSSSTVLLIENSCKLAKT